jgi:hypothetical protein
MIGLAVGGAKSLTSAKQLQHHNNNNDNNNNITATLPNQGPRSKVMGTHPLRHDNSFGSIQICSHTALPVKYSRT